MHYSGKPGMAGRGGQLSSEPCVGGTLRRGFKTISYLGSTEFRGESLEVVNKVKLVRLHEV